MPGVDPSIICQRLSIDPKIKPVKQKANKKNAKQCQALCEEVDRLLRTDFIRETHYPDWLANPNLVKKKSSKWRICIDFININQACSKDSFPLSMINQLVDAMASHELLSFMGTYSGYNQIKMYPETKTRRH